MMYTFDWLGVTMFGLAAIVILGLLVLLLFLAVARHRLLGLAVLGCVLLFVGLPLIWLTAVYREAEYRSAVRQQQMRIQQQRARWVDEAASRQAEDCIPAGREPAGACDGRAAPNGSERVA